jgi:hypothetical protein
VRGRAWRCRASAGDDNAGARAQRPRFLFLVETALKAKRYMSVSGSRDDARAESPSRKEGSRSRSRSRGR